MKEKILLSLLIPYLAIGAVVCNEVDGKMVCSGTGQLEADIGGNYLIITNLVVTNVVGVCTNCVQMSEEKCVSIKSDLDYLAQDTLNSADNIRTSVGYIVSANDDNKLNIDIVEGWIDEGLIDESSGQSLVGWMQYNVDITDNAIASIDQNVDYIEENANIVKDLASQINCNQCESFSPAIVTNNNTIVITNQGSSVSGNWATYDQMEALLKSANDINIFVRRIKGECEKLNVTVSNFWKQTHSDLQGISNLVHRLDDYVLGDYSNSVQHIVQNLIVVSNELSNIQRRFFSDYKNITDESNVDDRLKSVLDAEGKWDKEELFLHTNWFDRIELYLARIAGLPNSTDDDEITVPQSPVDTTKLDEEMQKSEDLKDDSEALEQSEFNRLQEISDGISSIFQVISDFVNVNPTKEIDIITNVNDQDFQHLTLLTDVDIYVDTEQPFINNILKIFRLATSAFWICSIAALSIFLLFQIYSALKKLFFYVLEFINALYGNV